MSKRVIDGPIGAATLARACYLGLRAVPILLCEKEQQHVIRACLRAAGVEHHFDFVVGYPKLFGKAKALRRILRRERIDRAEVLFVGDELRDVQAGRKAKVPTVAVTWGFHAEGLLAGGGPTFVVRQPGELLGVTTAA